NLDGDQGSVDAATGAAVDRGERHGYLPWSRCLLQLAELFSTLPATRLARSSNSFGSIMGGTMAGPVSYVMCKTKIPIN
ncbi:MAG: hypothetical protein ABW168_10960, partial [Sedimenticola sp.]